MSSTPIYTENQISASKKDKQVVLDTVTIDNEAYFKISNNNEMRPFFMSIVSDSNHWLFISSNGALTAGRKNSQFALFPYYTDDKITESVETTGSKSIFRIVKNDAFYLWEPFSERFSGKYDITRNVYKNTYGNKIIFEEINNDLKLCYRYQWNSSDSYGFVRRSNFINLSDDEITVEILDGLQNILPYGVGSDLQNASSNLVDAYKWNELEKKSGLGIYALSAIIVDKAEPSEALKANVVWSLGFNDAVHLMSSLQLDAFRANQDIHQEVDVKAEKGAYFINTKVKLEPQGNKRWMLIANVNQNHSDISKLINTITSDAELECRIRENIELGTQRLINLNAASDGLQSSTDKFRDARHFSNTLFNIMRGGIFDNNYQVEKNDFKTYLLKASKNVYKHTEAVVDQLEDVFSVITLHEIAFKSNNKNFTRLCLEYMPLKFSRRHGDPSRPWNKFSINTRSEVDGSKILDYEGNWRDIFQNWEALGHSYPEFIESMICKFLNATTFEGYNPYRVTKDGFDWEIIEPDDPWSYIGYWGDHQIIYLLKFLELIEEYKPGKLESYFNQDLFVYANVPYKIKAYQELLNNPKDTIEFDESLDEKIRDDRDKLGADGALLINKDNDIVKVNFIEKILATTLAKMSNFIPEGGIWMNTQRPEWNDANNALVGNGVSMVTLYYLRRFFNFFSKVLDKVEINEVAISNEMFTCFNSMLNTLTTNKNVLKSQINDHERKTILDGLGQAASAFRTQIYSTPFSGHKTSLAIDAIKTFINVSNQYLEHSIQANKRTDNLYHAYNLMTVNSDNSVSISYLDEMLEGQVAVLSSGYLSSSEALKVLDALKSSKLFREDQYSYVLYPNKKLKGFLERNTVQEDAVKKSKLLQELVKAHNKQIIEQDINGVYHFNGNIKNANDLQEALNTLLETHNKALVESDRGYILNVFETVFNHKAFTGRSGTFYGYEGLGSIYWHMVSKLLLAAQECCLKAINEGADDKTIGRLLEHYYEINEGIGVHKSPELYGAFPTDPYSHTPGAKGAQQPGMTGQVKEDVLSRFGELGVFISKGCIMFNPCLLRKEEFLIESRPFDYITVSNKKQTLQLDKGSMSFTYCQVPVVYHVSEKNNITIYYNNGTRKKLDHLTLDSETSKSIFLRQDEVSKIEVNINSSLLK